MGENLRACRLAAHALNEMCAELRLGNLAERFSGEDPDDWLVHSPDRVVAKKHGRQVAEIEREDNTLHIVVQDVFLLIRNEHLDSFDPRNYDIVPDDVPDWKGETGPDLVVEWDLPPGLKIPDGPRMPLPPDVRDRPIRVKSSFQ